jgi:hypothetical protein
VPQGKFTFPLAIHRVILAGHSWQLSDNRTVSRADPYQNEGDAQPRQR